jgi:hypothetical protein
MDLEEPEGRNYCAGEGQQQFNLPTECVSCGTAQQTEKTQ